MPKVQVLSSDVISKIAAGEVIDRPASVVKELLENSLDAGATGIELHVKNGGKTLIHLKDDGCGIAKDDMSCLFARHATSKIRTAGDLDSILSLGFRGEALYSIGAISEVVLKSRSSESDEAWEMTVKGGEKGGLVPAAMPSHGVDIRVGEIFFNTPARKKFLKADTSEFDAILNVVVPYTILYPNVRFLLTHNGRTVLDLRAGKKATQRAAEALGLKTEHLIASGPHETEGLKASFILGDINIQRPRRDMEFLFVNGRPVQSKGLLFHLNESYKLILPPSVHPFFAVMLDVPAQEVDVNVHPSKREVRLHQEPKIGLWMRRLVEQALMKNSSAREPEDLITPNMPVAKSEGIPESLMRFGPGQRGFSPEMRTDSGSPFESIEPPDQSSQRGQPAVLFPEDSKGRPVDLFNQDQKGQPVALSVDGRPLSLKERLASARFVGTFIRKYHLFEVGESLFVIDQHAAQERILFEKYRRQIVEGRIESQTLLTPEVINATPGEMLAFEHAGDKLAAFGFEVEAFGPNALAIRSIPTLLPNAAQAVRILLGEEDLAKADPDKVASRACRASVMAGDNMVPIEASHQLKALFDCEDPYTCPHGRPIFIELKSSFLDRQFLRS